MFSGLILLTIYLIPALLATARKHKNATAIWILNIFAGWTFIGWVGALVWVFVKSGDDGK